MSWSFLLMLHERQLELGDYPVAFATVDLKRGDPLESM